MISWTPPAPMRCSASQQNRRMRSSASGDSWRVGIGAGEGMWIKQWLLAAILSQGQGEGEEKGWGEGEGKGLG